MRDCAAVGGAALRFAGLSERVSLQGTMEDGSDILMQTPQEVTVYRAGGAVLAQWPDRFT